MEKILEKISLLQLVLPWILVWGILCVLEKGKRKKEKMMKEEKRYVIKNDNIFFPFFLLGTFLFSFCLFYSIFFTEFDISVVISCSAFVIFFAILTLDSEIWRVTVDGDVIKYRSFYGITKIYNFNDITKGVYTKKGSLKIYIGEKRIFTFYDNLEFSLFEQQMRKKKISIEYKENVEIIRPQSSYVIINIFVFIAFGIFSFLCCVVESKNLFLCILSFSFLIISAIILIDLCFDKVVVEGDIIHRKRFMKKECSISFANIEEVKIHKGVFRENLLIYENGKKVMTIWVKNEGVNWLKAKLQKKKIHIRK